MGRHRTRRGLARFALAVLLGAAPVAARADKPAEAPPAAAIDEALRLAAGYLVRHQRDDGLFVFDLNLFDGTAEGAGDTRFAEVAFLARQAGAAFALAKYATATGDPATHQALARVIQAFADLSLPVGRGVGQRTLEDVGLFDPPAGRRTLQRLLGAASLLYVPEGEGRLVAYGRKYDRAWVGTTALALLTAVHHAKATGDDRFAELRVRWARGLGVLFVPGVGFRQLPELLTAAAYADGEAWLALATYAAWLPDEFAEHELLAAVDTHMIDAYTAARGADFAGWGGMAARVRYAATGDERLVELSRRLAARAFETAAYKAGIYARANTCALVEGLAAIRHTLIASGNAADALVADIDARVAAEMAKNLALQVRPGQREVAGADGAYMVLPAMPEHAGAFLSGRYSAYTRVDYTQHCISALVDLRQ